MPAPITSGAAGRGLGQGSDDGQLGAEPVGVSRTPPAVAAGGPPLAPLRWGDALGQGSKQR
jgi:hypothetical protein